MIRLTDMAFLTLPADQGQMVETSFALDSENELLIRRSHNRCTGTVTYAAAAIDLEGETAYEPQSGVLPDTYGEWMPVVCDGFTREALDYIGVPEDDPDLPFCT